MSDPAHPPPSIDYSPDAEPSEVYIQRDGDRLLMSTTQPTCDAQLGGLLPEEFERLGTSYSNGPGFRVEDSGDVFRILPPKTPVIGLAVMTLVIASFFVGFWWVSERYAHPPIGWGVRSLIVIIGIIATGGALAGHLLRLRYLQRRGAPLEFDRRTKTVRIDGGRQTFNAADVVCVQSLTSLSAESQKNLFTDLNLIVSPPGQRRVRHLLLTCMDGRSGCLDYLTKPLRAATGLRVVRCYRTGLFGRGKQVVEDVE